MTADLQRLARDGWLRRVDARLGELVMRLFPESAPEVGLAAALAARAVADGHSALQLDAAQAWLNQLDGRGEPPVLPDVSTWMAALRASNAVASGHAGLSNQPLLLDAKGRVYLKRYFGYERRLAGQLIARARTEESRNNLEHLLPPLAGKSQDKGKHAKWLGGADSGQVRAMRLALQNRFALITGGPGTGKTTTVVRIAALLAQFAQREGRTLNLALAAPTGKAAARLAESVRAHKAALRLPPEIAAMIPEHATTLHNLLGLSPHRPQPKYRHDAPLPCDAVIVDEVSMVDLPLMAKLVDAVAPAARLVLLGDPRQLAAVEAGDVLGALAQATRESPLRDCAAQLTRSHRYDSRGALGRLAAAIAEGDTHAASAALDDVDGIRLIEDDTRGVPHSLIEQAVEAYRDLLAANDARGALTAARRFRVLTALRRGPQGCIAIDQAIEGRLKRGAGARADTARWRGRLLMVTANRAELGLFNGDIGVLWPDADGGMKVWFEAADGALRALSPAVLPPCEGAFALTVHKAQGSEFERIALVLGADSPVLTRELLYTGVTRARIAVTIYGDAKLLRAGIARRTQRWNGLADRLRETATDPGSIAESLPTPF